MNVLFVHQNFPGQYLHLARYLLNGGGHTITGLGEAANIRQRGAINGLTTIGYPTPEPAGNKTHHYLQGTEAAVRRGQTVARSLLTLKGKGYRPDVISAHPGWGEALFLRDVYPDVPIVMFCEFFFHSGQADLGFDPEFPVPLDWDFSVRIRNAAQLISLPAADALICPTRWQASRYPAVFQKSIRILHDGIDTGYMAPNPQAELLLQPRDIPGESRVVAPVPPVSTAVSAQDSLTPSFPNILPAGAAGLAAAGVPEKRGGVLKAEAASGAAKGGRMADRAAGPADERDTGPERALPGTTRAPLLRLTPKDKVLTYIGRNLEPYRGFHIFMRALPEIQRRHPDAHILIVGADGASYSPALPAGESYKARYLEEVRDRLRLSHVHFLGRVPYPALRALFQISSAHVYLTYPFVLSWSLLEAMSCGGLVVASRTAPVEEVITDGKNGLLVDFFDVCGLVEAADQALSAPEKFRGLREAARRAALERYELGACLKAQTELLFRLGKR